MELNKFIFYSGIVFWVLIISYVILKIVFGKNWIRILGTSMILGSGLKSSLKKMITEIRERNLAADTLSDVAVSIFFRFTRIGMIGLMISMIPVLLLWQQNRLIKSQNELFSYQNERIHEQTDLFKKQNEKMDLQNEYFSHQTTLFEKQVQQIEEQNKMFSRQEELSRLQMSQTSLNQKISVKPSLNCDVVVDGEKPGLYITNGGLGPAKIKSVSFYYKEVKYEQLREMVRQFGKNEKQFFGNFNLIVFNEEIDSEYDLFPDKSLHLLYFSPGDIDNSKRMKNWFNDVGIMIEYASLYGEKFTYFFHEWNITQSKPEK